MKRDGYTLARLVVCSALILLGGCQSWPETSGPPPRLTFEKMTYDFGDVSPNRLNKGQIKFTNTGEGVLKIAKVEHCCSVVAKLAGEKKKYAPGESGAVDIEFTSGSKPIFFKREFTVHSNDRENPQTKLSLQANIVLNLAWEPERLKLFLDEDNAACPEITVRSLDGQAFSVTRFTSTGDCIAADFDPSVKATKFVLKPKADLEKLGTNLKGNITIGVTHSDGNAAIVPFDVMPKYTVTPQVLLLLEPEPGKPTIKKISVLNNYRKDFEIESVSSGKSSNISVKVVDKQKIENGYELDLEMTFEPPDDKGLFMDELSVKIKGAEELPVPCRVWYSKKS